MIWIPDRDHAAQPQDMIWIPDRDHAAEAQGSTQNYMESDYKIGFFEKLRYISSIFAMGRPTHAVRAWMQKDGCTLAHRRTGVWKEGGLGCVEARRCPYRQSTPQTVGIELYCLVSGTLVVKQCILAVKARSPHAVPAVYLGGVISTNLMPNLLVVSV